ncbi:hypothetical protein TNIN_120031 [Trichonephila inaurata madagascariensis]|uniref:Uncharacterized protein n=1 Tax=Trichonephila inaurata madagascariensis TaxID=2747483 RepID=A0A8X7BV80_9ARAC|nr:hypothetical protein TNIN_120031 [Trichonephila inaurata madagascariensis]
MQKERARARAKQTSKRENGPRTNGNFSLADKALRETGPPQTPPVASLSCIGKVRAKEIRTRPDSSQLLLFRVSKSYLFLLSRFLSLFLKLNLPFRIKNKLLRVDLDCSVFNYKLR